MNEFENPELTQEEIERKQRDDRRIYLEGQLEEMKAEAKQEAEKEERKQYEEAEAKREYYIRNLTEQLARFRVRYPERFTANVDALLNPKELVEMRCIIFWVNFLEVWSITYSRHFMH